MFFGGHTREVGLQVHRALNRTRVCAWIGIKVKHSGTSSNSYAMLAFALAFFGFVAHAQTISPVVVEYQERGEGKFELTNSSLQPLVVVLEPKSFSIAPDGAGMFRPLDPAIHVELSTMSVRLLPKQSYTVFYKAWADSLPQWFTIYASFSSPQRQPGLSVRIMLPHTVYLCQKKPLRKEAIMVSNVFFDQDNHRITFDVENHGAGYGRIRSAIASGGRESADIGGFALLPGGLRHVAIPWSAHSAPQQLQLRFDSFDLKSLVRPFVRGIIASSSTQ